MRSSLSPLQRELLREFFRKEKRFFLTGGAALAGFCLGHRETADLDLFVTEPCLDDGELALREAAGAIGADVETVQTAPDFRRRLVRRAGESVVVDLVFDGSPQGEQTKQSFGEVRVDPPGEVLANELCALLSRAEVRDLVDVRPAAAGLDRARLSSRTGTAESSAGTVIPAEAGIQCALPGPRLSPG